MKKKLRVIEILKAPPAWLMLAVWTVCIILIAAAIALTVSSDTSWYACIVYAAAAVTLALSVYMAVKGITGLKRAIVARARRHRFTDNMISDYGFRTVAFFALSLTVNVGFALFNGAMGIATASVWYGIMACYYIFLSGLRGGILWGGHRIKDRANSDNRTAYALALRLYRRCGIFLFLLEIALSAAVALMILSERPTAFSEAMAIACATYTFYKIIFAVINLKKVKKLDNPLLQSLRNINLVDAAVSLFSLQVTMVAVFSDGKEMTMNIFNTITGFIVCALAIVLGIIMIVSATVKLNKIAESKDKPNF